MESRTRHRPRQALDMATPARPFRAYDPTRLDVATNIGGDSAADDTHADTWDAAAYPERPGRGRRRPHCWRT
ncbi:hypothetical protein ACWEKM_06405 [Streptomyces sp. NPDC004752]